MRNHHQQQKQDQEPLVPSMDFHKNPNLETTQSNHHHHVLPTPSSLQDFKRNHHQHNIHISKRTHEDEGFIFKNPNSLSCDSLVAGEEYTPMLPPPPPPQDFKKAHHQHNNILVSNKKNKNEGFTNKDTKKSNSVSRSSSPVDGEQNMTTSLPDMAMVEESGRERLKRHRVDMAGRVWIPDIWGHEDLLKDWIDCTVFDSSLGNNSIMSARASLIQESRSTVRIENKC